MLLTTKVVAYSKHWEDVEAHEIIVANRADTGNDDQAFLWLDKFVYTVVDGSESSSTTIPATSQVSTSPIATQDASSLSKTAIGVIAGGTIGGILFTLAVVFVLFFLRRLKKQRARRVEEENLNNWFMMENLIPTPLIITPTPPDNEAMDLLIPEPMSNGETRLIDVVDRTVVTLTTRTRVVRREEDGGSFHGFSEFGGESVGTLPPDYNDLIERRQS